MMSFETVASKSSFPLRYLFTVDISNVNTQWINIGAGVWYCSFNNLYSYVDASLLSDEYTTQTFGEISSLTVDAEIYARASTLASCAATDGSFYYDSANRSIYVHTQYNDSPYLHKVKIGVVSGYANRSFTPAGSTSFYDGRLLRAPSVSRKRDDLFWGKLQFDISGVELHNGDGSLDEFAENNDVYGNAARLYVGYDGLDISEYKYLYSGTLESFKYSDDTASFSIADKRKTLEKMIGIYQPSAYSVNAVQTIINTLTFYYGDIFYTDEQFDTASFEYAKLYTPKVAIDTTALPELGLPAIEIIEQICASVRGVFLILPDGRFSFKLIDPTKAAVSVIPYTDIMNKINYEYDPSEVLSSVKVGYSKNWSTGAYTYYTDSSREADIYSRYKVYKERTFDTLLTSLSDAQAFASSVLDYTEDVHATFEAQLPLKYYSLEIGDMVFIEHGRRGTVDKPIEKCEVMGITLNLDSLSINVKFRKYDYELVSRATKDGYTRITTDKYIRGAVI